MGFFSFGKKKNNVDPPTKPKPPPPPPAAPKTAAHLRRPSNLVNTTSASSSRTASSSGSSAGSPPQPLPLRSQTSSSPLAKERPKSLSFSPESFVPPVARFHPSASHSQPGSSTSLNLIAPNAPYAYANRDLEKKGSTNTLNSTRSTANTKRGAHQAPRISPHLAAFVKPRASSYHAPLVKNIWITSASTDAVHSTARRYSTAPARGNAKYYSTGSPAMMNRSSSYFNAPQQQHPISDAEFKEYATKYDTAIAKAHILAREYHHLPPAKRDRQRFERVGYAFAAAAQISREHWSYRCRLEKERLEALLETSRGWPSDAEVKWDEFLTHRVAGKRATEGWEYASMLADAWGVKEEMTVPLEDMPVLQPTYPAYASSWSGSSAAYYADTSSSPYLHPGYTQSGYAAYISQAPTAASSSGEFGMAKRSRVRIDSGASAAPSLESHGHSTSSHTHSGLSHSLQHSKSHQGIATPPSPSGAASSRHRHSSSPSYVPSPLKKGVAASSVVEVKETVLGAPKERPFRERGNSLPAGATPSVTGVPVRV